MATTTASLSISSSDLQPGNVLNINASSTLMKTGLTEGLEIVDMGKSELTVANSHKALHEALGTAGTANWIYLCNNATDDTFYIEVVLHDTVIGRLYAGDWMFSPWSQSDGDAEWSIEAEGGTCPYEYAFFKSSYVLPDSTQADSLNP
tara:strand:+ start:548 stop:991 length:444 start_codon:yes stop_codon:yes gene_type:complete